MADFCKTCSEAIWGRDFGDLANLLKPEQYDAEHGALALCECCGPIVVGIDGKRMWEDFDPRCNCGRSK